MFMPGPPVEFVKDLAVARSGGDSEGDDPRYLRGRIAILLWFAGVALCLVVGTATRSGVLALACFVALNVGLWLFAFRPGTTSAGLRRLLKKS